MIKEVVFSKVDNNVGNYPKPVIPMLPQPSLRNLLRFQSKIPQDSIIFGKRYRATINGRTAIALALQLGQLNPGDKLLLPAYHCRSMVEPGIWLDLEIEFYELNPDLSINMESLLSLIDKQTKAVLITHYFGFGQKNIKQIHSSLRAKNILLIEDCAHSFYGRIDGVNFGNFGDFVVASSRKFFPSSDGGILINNQSPNLPILSTQKLLIQLKSIYQSFSQSTDLHRNQILLPLFRIASLAKKRQELLPTKSPRSLTKKFQHFVPTQMHYAASGYAKWVMRRVNHPYIVEKRRENFTYLSKNLSRVKIGEPFYPCLPDEVTPYVYPFFLHAPNEHFAALKNWGFPIWRWDELAQSSCYNSKKLGAHLIQIPCHQDLKRQEIEWMVNKIKLLEQAGTTGLGKNK